MKINLRHRLLSLAVVILAAVGMAAELDAGVWYSSFVREVGRTEQSLMVSVIDTPSANLLDFTARTYDPAILLFQTQDPKATKYTSLNSYLYCGSDPVNRVDPSGMEWSISQSDDGKLIKIHFTGVVINNSAKEFDLNEVAKAIAHEVGHTGGLDDTNLPSNQLPIDDMNSNLMTQIASLDKGTDVNKATKLQTNQINEIVKMYRLGKLNQNSPLRKRYNPQLHSTWPYITITSKYLCR